MKLLHEVEGEVSAEPVRVELDLAGEASVLDLAWRE